MPKDFCCLPIPHHVVEFYKDFANFIPVHFFMEIARFGMGARGAGIGERPPGASTFGGGGGGAGIPGYGGSSGGIPGFGGVGSSRDPFMQQVLSMFD